MGGRTSTTRHGTGSGYGGPARGEGNKAAGPGRPKGMKTGEGKKATFRALMAPHVPETAQRWIDIINDPNHPHHHTMVLKHAELEGEFKQAVEHSGNLGFVVYGEREAESVDAWQKDHAPK